MDTADNITMQKPVWKIIGLLCIWCAARLIIESIVLKIVTSSDNFIFLFYNLIFIIGFVTLLIPVFSLRKPFLLIFVYILYSVFLFTNLNYFFYYNIPMDMFGVMTVAGDGIDAFIRGSTIFRIELLFPLLDLPLFVYIVIKYGKIHSVFKLINGKRIFIPMLVIVFLFVHVFRLSGEAKNSEISHNEVIRNHGLLVYSAAKPYVFTPANRELLISLPQNDGTVFKRDINGKIVKIENLASYGFKKWVGRSQADVNFLLIQVESLQCGFERIRHNGKLVMPYLNSLRNKSVYYPYCFAYHTAGGTSDCEVSVFNNIEPADGKRMTSNHFDHEGSFLKLMPDYDKFAFHNYIKEFFNRANSYPKIGFDFFYDFNAMQLPGKAWGSEDRLMWEYIIKHENMWQEPFFYYAITLTSHPGFGHIVNYHNAEFLNDIKRKRDKDALNSFNYVDIQLSKFIPEFRKRFPNTYIFIYGDHSLATVNFAGHMTRSAVTIDEDFLEFVPLYILTPDDKVESHPDILASFHDIGPTVLSLSKRPAESEYITYPAYGGSLLNDEVQKMSMPFNGKLLDRTKVLNEISGLVDSFFKDDK